MNNTFTSHRLSNGLLVHLKEIHTAPLISQWIWYRVGSRNEIKGKTGLSHWVEHMQFKGTPSYPAGVLDKAISRFGGIWNAMTYLDWTAYFETMPADHIQLAIELEASRMHESTYDVEEVESERTVVISEREGNENIPIFRLDEAVQRAAFDEHAYKNEVIGEMEDLLSIKRDDLYHHYKRYYAPSNAVLCLAGDFETREILEKIEKLYGGLKNEETGNPTIQPEGAIEGERKVEVKGPGETVFVRLSYRAPQANHPDYFAFTILDSLLGGPSPMNMFGGGGISNKTSRLYQALVEKELAVGVNGSLQPTIDPYLYDITVTVHPEKKAEDVLVVLDDEIKKLQDTFVQSDEIARAAKQARAQFVYGAENITNQAFWMGYAEMFAHYDWFEEYVDRLRKITPEEVNRVACTWLQADHRVVGIYIPENGGEEA
ncbi:MAG: pitrilysin family protein [Anaerolineaceae bacterium]